MAEKGDKLSRLSYFSIFANTFVISLFAIGGGYVMIPMLQERFVERYKWLDGDEFSALMALGQSAPGALIVNTTAMVGYRLLGVGGALCALVGTALPAILVIIIVGYFYEIIRDNAYVSAAFRGMRAGVAAIIADTVINMAQPYFKREKLAYGALLVAAFLVGFFFDVNVAFIIVGCALLGLIIGIVRRRREAGK